MMQNENIQKIDNEIMALHIAADQAVTLVAAVVDFIFPEIEKYLEYVNGQSGLSGQIRDRLSSATVLLSMARERGEATTESADGIEKAVFDVKRDGG